MGIMTFLAVIIVTAVAYVAYQQWLQHHRRIMIHREQLAAIEKGVQLPTIDREIERRSWNVQRLLLLAGLCWISLGVSALIFFSTMHMFYPRSRDFADGRFLALPVVLIGVSHLIVYRVGRNK
jgi:hypothetical protein